MSQKKFVPRQRKRRVLDKLRASSTTAVHNELQLQNAEVIIPLTRSERDERKAGLREQVLAQHAGTKISRQKQKRLDKYIQNKLHKEEKADLLKRIVDVQNGIERSLLKSTKMLGRGREERREIMQRAVRERDHGINVEQADKILMERRRSLSSDGPEGRSDNTTEEKYREDDASRLPQPNGLSTFGSGLKRQLRVDEGGLPLIKKRKRERGKGFKIDLQASAFSADPIEQYHEDESEAEWEGFGSDAGSGNELEVTANEWNAIGHSDTERHAETASTRSDGDSSDREISQDDSTSDLAELSDVSGDETLHSDREDRTTRTSAFKAWAETQRDTAVGFQPSNMLNDIRAATKKITFVPRPIEQDPLPSELQFLSGKDRQAHAVQVRRSEDVQTTRLALPVVAKEQEIMEAIFNNDVVIISGATGSGKTTQVPQFLFENGFGDPNGPTPGMIGVTQPRRVAAVSMAKRVSDELGAHKDVVAHQIRFDSTVSNKTAIKFMTDGVLLREMADDFALKKYSAIIIDEAHERTVNTDILISLMSRCIKARSQLAAEKTKSYTSLKLIIMSATLRVSDFRENTRLFKISPPLVHAEGRQFDVTVHWSRRTHADYVEEAFKKVSRGHKKLPPGGILVFLTGQNEIRLLAKRLKQAFINITSSGAADIRTHVSAKDMVVEPEDLEYFSEDGFKLASDALTSADEADDEDEEAGEFTIEDEQPVQSIKVHILPLYSQLPSKEQLKVFETPPADSRIIVLATNVAETSLTIPGIRYVFDSGRVKERKWDRAGVQTFTTTWVSKASADQRMGRAGRTGPGHCYRLYSSAMYEGFDDFAEPEIYRSPLEGVVLQLKSLNIAKIDNFPFPTPPERSNMVKAEQLLCHLGALDSKARITAIGKELQVYPLSPRFAQILRLGIMYNCVDFAIAIVAVLDVPEVIVSEAMLGIRVPADEDDETDDDAKESQRKAYGSAQGHLSQLSPVSDAMKLLMALVSYCEASDAQAEDVCDKFFLRHKALKEANQLREQLHKIVDSVREAGGHKFKQTLAVPNTKEVGMLRQMIAAGFIDQIAIRADCLPSPPEQERKPRRAIDVRYVTLLPSHDALSDSSFEEGHKYVYLHPSSLLARTPASKTPRYVVYQRLQRSQASKPGSASKTRMHPLTPVSGEQLAILARGTTLLSVGKPFGKVQNLPHVNGTERRQCFVVLSLVGRQGDMGWPLVRKEVVQRREPGEGWVVEKYID